MRASIPDSLNACVSCKLIKVDLERFGYPGQDIYRARTLAVNRTDAIGAALVASCFRSV